MIEASPALGVAWVDADAYCKWATEAAHARGERVRYRLPHGLEWEKAARGADGRSFPWGNFFDWTFTKGGQSRPLKKGTSIVPEAVGAFPLDVSPYGVHDCAGSVMEWCDELLIPGDDQLQMYRGGSYISGDTTPFHVASRAGTGVHKVELKHGFRVLRELE
jgi:formylglycine-generating enzyme required for sulfatase activity